MGAAADDTAQSHAQGPHPHGVPKPGDIFALLPYPLVVVSRDGLIQAANRACTDILDEDDPGDLAGKPLAGLIAHPYRARLAQLLGRGARDCQESVLCNRRGRETPVELTLIRPAAEADHVLLVCIEDITWRKRALEALNAERNNLCLLYENNPDPLLVIAPNRTVLYANTKALSAHPAGRTASGRAAGQDSGAGLDGPCHRLIAGSDSPCEGCEFEAVMRTGRARTSVGELATEQGERRWLHRQWYALCDLRDEVTSVVEVSRDITEVKLTQFRLEETVARLQQAIEGTVQAMSMAVEARDPYTAGHQRRVSALAHAIATAMGLGEEEEAAVRVAGLVHDIGKMGVPAEILSKPGAISDVEHELIRTHPARGHEILGVIDFPWPVADIVWQHHERLDGTGYPLGLAGDDILMGARVVAVADVVEAMAHHRPYRSARGIGQALDEIRDGAGREYDVGVVDTCVTLFEQDLFGFDRPPPAQEDKPPPSHRAPRGGLAQV